MAVVQIPCYCATLRQAARAVTALYDERFKPAGLRATQFTILQTLDFQPGARIADMVEWLAIDQTTLTRNLALLEAQGLVAVVDRPSGREKCWGLTKSGASKFADARPLWEGAQADVAERFGRQRTRSMHADVHALANALAGVKDEQGA